MKRLLNMIIVFGLFFLACEIKPQPIEFGHDGCHYCSMGIVDAKFAAEIVTNTGKVYKYDSAECMIRSLRVLEGEPELVLVMDYAEPGTFIDAKTAVFLVSDDISSPMGANLSAFKSEEAITVHNKSDSIFDWTSIKDYLK